MKTLRDNFLEDSKRMECLFNGGVKTIGDSVSNRVNDEGYGFLYNALEYVDTIIHKPLYNTFHMRDLPYLYAGGAMEGASFYKSSYQFDSETGFGSGANSTFTTVEAVINKQKTRIVPLQYKIKLGFIDSLKAEKIGLDFLRMLDEAVLSKHNLTKDQFAYFGIPGVDDSYGLLNNPDITKTTAETAWKNMEPVTLFEAINGKLVDIATTLNLDSRLLPDRILVPTSFFSFAAKPLAVGTGNTSTPLAVSLLTYLHENLATNYMGLPGYIDILPLPYLETAGTGNHQRMVFYRYSEEVVRGVTGMELTRGATIPSGTDASLNTFFVAFEGEPQFIRTVGMLYYDNVE